MKKQIKKLDLAHLTTETNNAATTCIDQLSTLEMVTLINREDHAVAEAVATQLPQIAEAVDYIATSFKQEGRLFYFGAGTSGRLGVLDASECPPTFGTAPEMVQGYIAGGDDALRNPIEGAEDDYSAGADEVTALGITDKDTVVGITASGRTTYVLGALESAKAKGAHIVGVCNNSQSELHKVCDVTIAPVVGGEVIQGSTRLKSGTAQKMVLNMLTTGAMIKIGKVYKNYMVDMKPSNEKLLDRAVRLVMATTETDYDQSLSALSQCDFHVKTAIVMITMNCDARTATALLENADGYVARALH